MAKPTRLKAKAAISVPQTRDDAAADIRVIGDLTRKLTRTTAEMNDKIAVITAEYQPTLEAQGERIKNLQEGVQSFCEAYRAELTDNGRVKTANLVTGDVSWRQRPPSVGIRGMDAVIDTLKRLALGRFIRTKEEINKEAILNEPDAVRGVAGITLVTGVEDFVITPFEQDAAAA